MLSRVHIIAVFVCFGVGMGIAPQFLLAHSPNSSKDFFSFFRTNKSPVVTEGASNASSAASYYRLARMYAEQNDAGRANANFSLALQNATPRQIAAIATDYAAFLTESGDLRRAELMLRQALAQSPDDTELTRMLARCLVKQDKMVEGLRYFRAIGTEAEAKAEIAAIYREQGDTKTLVAVEQRWGSTKSEVARPVTVRPESVRPAPTLIAAAPRSEITPRPEMVPPRTGGVVRTLPQPPLPAAVTSRADAAPRATMIAAAPVTAPTSKSEFFDSRVPIPVPRVAPLPVVATANPPSPAPIATQPALPKFALTNPGQLAKTTMPDASEGTAKVPSRPAVAVQSRRHYVVNAGISADLDDLLPIVKPAAATVAK